MKDRFTNYAGNSSWWKDPEYIRKIYVRGKLSWGIRIELNARKEKSYSDMGFRICKEKPNER